MQISAHVFLCRCHTMSRGCARFGCAFDRGIRFTLFEHPFVLSSVRRSRSGENVSGGARAVARSRHQINNVYIWSFWHILWIKRAIALFCLNSHARCSARIFRCLHQMETFAGQTCLNEDIIVSKPLDRLNRRDSAFWQSGILWVAFLRTHMNSHVSKKS